MSRREPPGPDLTAAEVVALDAALHGDPVAPEHRDLAVLVADVRASAPRMSPALAERLEAGMAGGFARPRRRPALPRPWLLAPAGGLVAATVVAVVLVSSGGGPGGPSARHAAIAVSRSPALAEKSAAGGATATTVPAPSAAVPQSRAFAAPPATDAAPVTPRRQERSASLTLVTGKSRVQSVADDVIRASDRFGGIVQSSTIGTGDGQPAEADFELRIPTARVDAALAALSALAHVAQRSQDQLDITASFASVQDRLSDARAERRGLEGALGRATTAQQVDSLKLRLRDATSRVARLKGDLAALRRRTDYSTVTLTVRGTAPTAHHHAGGGSWTPGDAVGDAARVLEVAAGVALVAIAVAVPLLLTGLLGLGGARLVRRRRREGALETA